MKDLIAKVLEIEEQARSIVAEAEKAGGKLTGAARTTAREILDAARAEAVAKSRQFAKDKIDEARAERERRLEEANAKSISLAEIAPEARQKAVEMVVAAVIGRR